MTRTRAPRRHHIKKKKMQLVNLVKYSGDIIYLFIWVTYLFEFQLKLKCAHHFLGEKQRNIHERNLFSNNNINNNELDFYVRITDSCKMSILSILVTNPLTSPE